jgi:hypothetical protein
MLVPAAIHVPRGLTEMRPPALFGLRRGRDARNCSTDALGASKTR